MDMDKLIRKLNTLEMVIERLLSLRQPLPILKEKLIQIEDLIADIEDDYEQQYTSMWRDKVANWWKNYALNLNNNGNFQEMTFEASNEYDEPSPFIAPNAEGKIEAKPVLSKMSPTLSIPPSTSILSITSNDDMEIQVVKKFPKKVNIYAKMEHKFGLLPPLETGVDFGGLKRLIMTIVLTFDQVPPNLDDPDLQSHVFDLAFNRLPENLRELFSIQYLDRSLFSLFCFIRLELEDFSDNFKTSLFASGTEKVDKIVTNSCIYCHVYGHVVENCPLAFCLNCFKSSHNWRNCVQGPIFY